MNQKTVGIVLVAIGAICFSAKAIFIKLAYQSYPVDAITLLLLRFGLSFPFFILIALWRYKKGKFREIEKKDIGIMALLSILGYYFASLFDFMGLQYLSAGLERVILFIYPTFVVIFSSIFLKSHINKKGYLALLITYLGIGIIAFAPEMFSSKDILKGTILILISALTYSLYLVFGGEMIKKYGSINFNTIGMIFTSGFVLIHFGLTSNVSISTLPIGIWAYGFALAIISTLIPTFILMEGISRLGASYGAIVASIGPVATIVLGYYFLNETLSIQEAIGSILVLVGVLLVK